MRDWIGGDIGGLRALADTLNSYAPKMTNVTRALDQQATGLTGEWKGASADAFSTAWHRDSITAQALSVVTAETGTIIGALASALADIEDALEEQASASAAHGVPIGAEGQPAPVPDGPFVTQAGADYQAWALAYQQVHQQAMTDAGQARTAAATQLMALYKQIAPQQIAKQSATASGNLAIGQLLADLWAVPTAERRPINKIIDTLESRERYLAGELRDAKLTGQAPADGAEDELLKVRGKFDAEANELDNTGRLENPLSKLLDARLSDVSNWFKGQSGPGVHVKGRPTGADALDAEDDEGGLLSKLIDIGGDLPVVDVAADLASTALGSYYDVKSGMPVGTAIRDNAISSTAAIAAGTAATIEVSALVGATVGGPVGAIAGVAVGAVVSVGVGDLTHNLLTENWGADVHQYGVAGGVAYGVGHVEFATADDAKAAAVGVGHTAEHVWDSVLSAL